MNATELAEAKAQHMHYGQMAIQMIDDLYPLLERRHYGKYDVADEVMDFRTAMELAELTPRQAQVCRLMSEGLEQKDVATELGVSQQAVSQHFHAAIRKIADKYEQWDVKEGELTA